MFESSHAAHVYDVHRSDGSSPCPNGLIEHRWETVRSLVGTARPAGESIDREHCSVCSVLLASSPDLGWMVRIVFFAVNVITMERTSVSL